MEGNNFILDLEPNEYRWLGNMLVRVAKDSKWKLEHDCEGRHDKRNYRDAVLFLDKLGIPESEVTGDEVE